MRKIMLAGALALAALSAAGCSGCSILTKAASPAQAVGQGYKVDEQAMGAVDALGSSANYLILGAVKTGALSREQLLQAKALRANIVAAHDAALAAYRAGNAKAFSEKLAALTELSNRAQDLWNKVKP